jgi:hypothetical protein
MFAQGGAAVPKEYKGFSKLPEDVQMKMDPSLAKKYDEGGEVATRQPGPEDYDDEGELYYDPAREALKKEIRDWIAGGREGPVPKYDPNKQYFGEGEVTRTDSEAVGMAMGGDPAMAQGLGSMVQAPPMPAQESVDPAIMQDMLMRAGEGIQDLENVDNYEQMMNMIRGDEASIPERRTELAGLVGEQDAAQTPESVLALVQPVVQIASVDEGIGGLAQETMTESVEGPMAEGIMSTMAPPEPAPMPPTAPPMMGGPPPANFKDGGLVRRGDNQPVKMMQAGGDPFKTAPGRLGELARERMSVRQGLLGDPEGRLQEQKDLTQAQMLFDVANTALAFAAPMEGERPGMSAAERLAMAARTTQLPQTIGARAAQLGEFKSGLGKEKQALQLAALGSAETALAAEAKATADAKLAKQKSDALAAENALDRSAKISQILLEGSQASELAENKANWRASLQDDQQAAEADAAALLASNNKALQREGKLLQQKIDVSKMLLKNEMTLDQLGVENAYKLNQDKIGHDYAMILQDSKNAVTREMKGIDQQMKAVDQTIAMDSNSIKEAALQQKAAFEANRVALEERKLELEAQGLQNTAQYRANQTAIAYADQDIKRAEMLQTADATAQKQLLDQQKLELAQRKQALEEASKGLETFGAQGKNKAQSILANTALLEGYANNTLTDTQTLQVNNAIDMLSTRETIVQDGKTVKTGGNIPEAARQAVIKRSQLSVPEDQQKPLMPRDLKRITAKPAQFGEAVSKIMKDVPDASIAFGSDAVARNVTNTVVEAISFGIASAPFESTQKAISAVEQLNLDTVTHFQDIKELRDSVALLNMLKNQTADPNAFLTGDTKAKNKTKTVMDTIDELISVLDLKINNMTDVDDLNEARLGKQKALQLRAGFEAINRAYARAGSGGRTTTTEIEAQQDQILFGN